MHGSSVISAQNGGIMVLNLENECIIAKENDYIEVSNYEVG